MSAIPSIATQLFPHNEPSLRANRVLARRSKDRMCPMVVMRVVVMRKGMGAGGEKAYNCMVLRAKTINMTWRWP
jgi:hypothetical protein